MGVLVAETDSVVAAAIQLALEDEGWEVAAVANSLDAWDRIGAEPPDLLITRIVFGAGQVPGTALGSRAHSRRIPVIYISSNVQRAVHGVAEHGAVLIKPSTLTKQARPERRACPG